MDASRDLEAATRGDRAALRRVVGAWMPRIRRWAFVYCGRADIAEDAVQDSLVRLLRFIPRYDPTRPFGPWLKTLVLNACRSELARQSRHRVAEAEGPDLRSADVPPDRQLDLDRAARRAFAAFATLTPRQRQIVDLVDLQGVAPVEAAATLGITAGAVRGQLFQARRTLRQHLCPDDLLPLLREA